MFSRIGSTGVPSRFRNLAEPEDENWTANRLAGGAKGFLSPTAAAAVTSAERATVLKRSETKREPNVLKPILQNKVEIFDLRAVKKACNRHPARAAAGILYAETRKPGSARLPGRQSP